MGSRVYCDLQPNKIIYIMLNPLFPTKGLSPAVRITLIYAIFGFLWVVFSDALLAHLATDILTMARIQTYKGGIFIILTSGLVFLLINTQTRYQQQIEQKLRQSEQHHKEACQELQIILDHVPAFIIFKNDQNVILRVNKKAADSAGTTAEAMAGKPTSLFYPEYAEHYYQDDLEVIRAGLPKLGIIEQTTTPEGKKIWIETNKIPIHIHAGNATELLVVALDITQHKQTELALQRQKALFEAVFADIPDALLIADLDRKIVMANPGTLRVFGYQPSELVGQSALSLYANDEDFGRQGQLRFNKTAEENLQPYIIQYRRRNGEIFCGESVGTVIEGPDGKPTGYLGLIRDVTDRIEKEREARELQEKLAHVARVGLMGEMAAGIAHEINQPLSAIANYAQACRRMFTANPTSPKLPRALEQITEQALRAGEIIHKLRTFVKQGEGTRESVDCNELVREVAKFCEMETRLNNLPLCLKLADALPPISADPVQIQQVILNLIHNSMDASKTLQLSKPEINIRTWHAQDAVFVAVEDNGEGVPEATIEEIFSTFFTTKSSGLGMGLSICSTIIKAHGGELNYKPNPSGGSIFYFSLPVYGD